MAFIFPRRSSKEKLKYHLAMSAKGAVYPEGSRFAGKKVSEFARGQHAAKAQQLIKEKDRWIEKNPDKLSAEHLQAHKVAKQKRYENGKNYGGK